MKSFLVFIFFLFFWFSIFIGSGALFSGYHLADDYEIIQINNDLISAQNDIIEVTKKWIKHDFKNRFKPVHHVHRVLETYLFGANFTLLLTYIGLIAVFTSFFLFSFLKKLHFSVAESILFSLSSMVGAHSLIWWSLGPNETIGMFMMSLSLVFMASSIYSEKGRFLYEALFIIFTTLMSLSKESFIMLIPALLFWKIWLYSEKNTASWLDSVKSNMASNIALFLVMSMELFIIIYWVGVGGDSPHTGGIHGFHPLSYVRRAIGMSLSISSVGLGMVSIAGILLLLVFKDGNESIYPRIKELATEFTTPLVLFTLIAVPQLALYNTSGFGRGLYARFLTPLIMGYSIFLIYLLRFMRLNRSIYFIKLSDRDAVGRFPLLCVVIGAFLCFGGITFLYNQNISNFHTDLGKLPPPHLAEILKPGMLALAGGIGMIIFAWVLVKTENRALTVANVTFLLALIVVFYKTVFFANAYEFAMEGKKINFLLHSVKKHTKLDDSILIVADPSQHEAGLSLKRYISNMAEKREIYVYPIFADDGNGRNKRDLIGAYEKIFDGNLLENIGNKGSIGYIIVIRDLEQKFLLGASGWFNMSHFNREGGGFFIIYYRKVLHSWV